MVQRFGGKRLGRDAVFLGGLFREVGHQQRDILAAFAQGRDRDVHHVEAVVEVFAERPRLHQRHEVLVRCRDDADVDFDFLAAAHALETALLKHAEQFDLQLLRY